MRRTIQAWPQGSGVQSAQGRGRRGGDL